MMKTLSNTRIRAITLSLLFILSGIGASVLINPASAVPNTAAPSAAAAAPFAAVPQSQANWEYPGGNAFNQDYNPQNQINASTVQYLGLSWLFPLPGLPSALTGYAGLFTGLGVDTAPIIVNGTAFLISQADQVWALNAANGDILWTYLWPITLNSTAGTGSPLDLHHHDGSAWFTTATFGSGVSGPTLWFQSTDSVHIVALNALTGKEELNFTDFSGFNGATTGIVGNSPTSFYDSLGASNLVVNSAKGIAITGRDGELTGANGRGFFAGWNINVNPVKLMWIAYTTPPQPNSNVALDPTWTISQINNMSSAETLWEGKGSPNGYVSTTELQGGVMMNTNDAIVVNWKSLTPAQLNTSLYNDWGQAGQSAQCQAITGGGSTGSTGSGWGGDWLLGSGPTNGIVYVSTNNKDPFTGPCNPGPDLWSASSLALNITSGQWIWGVQSTPHDIWDYDCSWWQAAANETVNGVNTPVVLKTCKNGYLYEINALTGDVIWAWTPPTNIFPRCYECWNYNPMNATQMSFDFPSAIHTFKTQPTTGPQPPYLQYPPEGAGFEDVQAYDPSTNTIFAAAQLTPDYATYYGLNATTQRATGIVATGYTATPINTGTCSDCSPSNNNSTVWGINAATGAVLWHHFTPLLGYRGGVSTSGGLVFVTLASGDMQILNAANGNLVRDFFIGGPMTELTSVGATATGQMELITPITSTGTTPGDIVALTLSGVPTGPVGTTTTTTVTSTAVSTTTVVGAPTTITKTTTIGGVATTITTTIPGSTTTITGSGSATTTTTTTTTTTSGGVSSTALYGVAAVAVIFIIATGYLAMRGRKPAS